MRRESPPQEKPEIPGEKGEVVDAKQETTLDGEKKVLFQENQDVLSGDAILKQIVDSFEDGWGELSEEQKKKSLQALREFIEKLRDYHDSYVNLKFAAKRTGLQLENVEKYQAAVKNADEREHILHNAFIDATNILARRMHQSGLDSTWRGDDKIYGIDQWATRQKLKAWMFEIFHETR